MFSSNKKHEHFYHAALWSDDSSSSSSDDEYRYRSTFVSDYSLESSWVWRYKLGTPVFGEFLPFFSADLLKLCQVGSGASLHRYLKVFPEMLDRDQVRALARPLKDIQRLLHCLGCVLRVVVSSDQRILFLMVWASDRCLLANSKWAVMCLLLRSGFRLAPLP